MGRGLADRWWAVMVRGVAGVLFGVLTFLRPGVSLAALVLLFGAWAIVDGIFALATAVQLRGGWPLVFEAVAGVVAGLVAFAFPGLTVLGLVWVVAAWSVVTGLFELSAAIRWRRELEHDWLLGLAGALSVGFGLLVAARPAAGALVLTFWIGSFALVFGAVLVGFGLRLRHLGRGAERRVPPGGVGTPA